MLLLTQGLVGLSASVMEHAGILYRLTAVPATAATLPLFFLFALMLVVYPLSLLVNRCAPVAPAPAPVSMVVAMSTAPVVARRSARLAVK